MTLTFESDLDGVKVTHHVKYLRHRSSTWCSKKQDTEVMAVSVCY